jgi:mannose-1-phosphate guanylyltransferase
VAFHHATGAEGTIALHRVEDPSAFGVVPTEADGRVTAFIEKPPREEAPTDLINAGTYVLEPAVLDRIAADQTVNVERVTFPAMVADGSLYALDGDTYWIDAGTPSTYLAANLDLVAGRRGAPEPGIHPDAEVDGAVVGTVMGPGARVADGAIVSGSVVMGAATIGPGALVRDAIIGARATIGAGAVLTGGTVVGDDVVVSDGDELVGVRVPEEG